MALITDLPASTTVASTDVFIKDTGSATQKITGANAADGLLGLGAFRQPHRESFQTQVAELLSEVKPQLNTEKLWCLVSHFTER